MRFVIPITEETREFIGKFLNGGVVPEVEERGTFFVFSNEGILSEIVPADDKIFRENDFNFEFVKIPVWKFAK